MDLVKAQEKERLAKMNNDIEKMVQQYQEEICQTKEEKRKVLKQRLNMKKQQLQTKRLSKFAQINKLEKLEKKMQKQNKDIHTEKKSLFSKNDIETIKYNDDIDNIYKEILEEDDNIYKEILEENRFYNFLKKSPIKNHINLFKNENANRSIW